MDLKHQFKSPFMIIRPFLIPTLITGMVASSNINVNIYDYLLCQERHFFFDLAFAEVYNLFLITFVILIIGTIVTTVIMLQPDLKSEYRDIDEQGNVRKPRYIRILRSFWAA